MNKLEEEKLDCTTQNASGGMLFLDGSRCTNT